jgi:hypothetical protein
MTSFEDRDPAQLTSSVWSSFRSSYALSRSLEDEATGWRMFLDIDQIIEDSLRALRMEWVMKEDYAATTDQLIKRTEQKIDRALDAILAMLSKDEARAMKLLVDLAMKAGAVSDQIGRLCTWENEEREKLRCN